MKQLTILVPAGKNNLSSIIGSYKILTRANEYWKSLGKKEIFQIQLAGTSKKIELYDGLFSIKPHAHISTIKKTNLIIIPSLNHHYEEAIKLNKSMITWIHDQYKAGADVASICTGAFLLASTGLLDEKLCSTHWSAAENFRNKFPKVNLVPDKIITEEHRIMTNGGAYSFLNLILFLVEKYYDRPTAIYCSKVFQIEVDRNSQSSFAIFSGQKGHGDDVIKKAQQLLEGNLQRKFSFEQIADELSVSRRNFDRRFVKATGNTPVEYLQRIKIEAAKRSFEKSKKSVSEVMYEVGYSDTKAFRTIFKKVTGLAPVEYRNRYKSF